MLLCVCVGPVHEPELDRLVEQLKNMGFDEVCLSHCPSSKICRYFNFATYFLEWRTGYHASFKCYFVNRSKLPCHVNKK